MGGYGSGRWQTGKGLTAGHRSIDVRRLQRDGLLTPGQAFAWNWTRDGDTLASVLIRTEADRLTLDYRYRTEGGDWHPLAYPVRLAWTPCTYGVRRAWFRCPAAGCGRRVALLYLGPSGIFACRHCYRLAYACEGGPALTGRYGGRIACGRGLDGNPALPSDLARSRKVCTGAPSSDWLPSMMLSRERPLLEWPNACG
jgi:hypothetical protein